MSADVETIIVGAGVIGLAIGRALSAQGQEVLILERQQMIGSQTSSRNSEVIHAGLYYETGSLRAQLCVRGKELLYGFCAQNNVTHRKSGKLLVAAGEDELPRLHAINNQAKRNGVTDLRFLTRHEAICVEPNLDCAAAYLSPSTGVIDSHGLMQALEGHLTSSGAQIVLATSVEGIARNGAGHFKLATNSGGDCSSITCAKLVLSGGLHASQLGKMLPGRTAYSVPRTYPTKGHYFTYAGPAPFSQPIYPMPVGAWLGVHLTLDVAGQTKFGPDIVWPGAETAAQSGPFEPDYSFEDEQTRRADFAVQIRRYFPGLDPMRLQPGYTGLRPKIYREGEPVPDFAIHDAADHGQPNLVALYGMESPGLTACLAIAEHVAQRL